jgi:hypothetical protein
MERHTCNCGNIAGIVLVILVHYDVCTTYSISRRRYHFWIQVNRKNITQQLNKITLFWAAIIWIQPPCKNEHPSKRNLILTITILNTVNGLGVALGSSIYNFSFKETDLCLSAKFSIVPNYFGWTFSFLCAVLVSFRDAAVVCGL